MSLRHRIIPCIKHHVSNLVEKSSHFRLRNPVYKKMEPFTLTISNRKVKVKEHEACPPDCDITPTDECKECEHYPQHTFDKLRLAHHIPPVDMFATEQDMADIRLYGRLIFHATKSMDGNDDNWHEEQEVRELLRQLLELFDIIREARTSAMIGRLW